MEIEKQMDYATKHFFFIADQRIKTFHVYAVLLAASAAASLAAVDKLSRPAFILAGAFNVLISVMFFLIEQRNIELLTTTKAGMLRIEALPEWPEYLRLGTDDEQARGIRHRFKSYRGAFAVALCGQFVFGICIILCGVLFLHHSPPAGGISNNTVAKTPVPTAQKATNAKSP